MSNKQIDARDTTEGNQSGMAITGTDLASKTKRALDTVICNEDPIEVLPVAIAGTRVLDFQEALNVVRNTETDILSYTVPVGKKLVISRIDCTGDNRAEHRLYIDGSVKEKHNTWWGSFDCEFIMENYEVAATKIVKITAEHFSPYGVGDFSATLKGALQDE